jgi:hypothetical protein
VPRAEQHELVVPTARERRLRSRAHHGEPVLAQRLCRGTASQRDAAGRIERVDESGVASIVVHPSPVTRGPPDGPCSAAATPRCAALIRSAASFEIIVVGASCACPERGADDPVVRHVRIEPVLDQEVLLNAVDLDLQSARAVVIGECDGMRERSAGTDAQLLDGSQRRARRASDVVRARLQTVELLDHHQRDHDVHVAEAGEAAGITDEDRRVEHHPRAQRGFASAGGRLRRRGADRHPGGRHGTSRVRGHERGAREGVGHDGSFEIESVVPRGAHLVRNVAILTAGERLRPCMPP